MGTARFIITRRCALLQMRKVRKLNHQLNRGPFQKPLERQSNDQKWIKTWCWIANPIFIKLNNVKIDWACSHIHNILNLESSVDQQYYHRNTFLRAFICCIELISFLQKASKFIFTRDLGVNGWFSFELSAEDRRWWLLLSGRTQFSSISRVVDNRRWWFFEASVYIVEEWVSGILACFLRLASI